MKKFSLLCATTLAVCSLAASPMIATGIAKPVAVQAAQKDFTEQNYAVMAYLKYTKQDLTNVQDHSVEVDRDHGHFEVDNENGADFTITVDQDKVTLTTTDQNGKKKSHTYSKPNLAKQFKDQQSKLNSVVEKDDHDDND